MDLSSSRIALSDGIPPELSDAIALQAELDAVRVAEFLEIFMAGVIAKHGDAGEFAHWRTRMPAQFLLELGAALRVLEWEAQRLAQPAMGLPDAQTSLLQLLRGMAGAATELTLLGRVTAAFVNHFAWGGRSELGVDVVLGSLTEDEVAERIAAFLWKNRHLGREANAQAATSPSSGRQSVVPASG